MGKRDLGDDGSSRLTGVADTAALSATGLLFVAAVLAFMALLLPWWVGESSVGQLADSSVTDCTVSLWDLEVDVGTTTSDGAGGTTIKIDTQAMTWSQMCDTLAKTEGQADECSQVDAVRAFTILPIIFDLIGVCVLFLARSVSPLLLLAGAVLSVLGGFSALIGIIAGAALSTSGLQGSGVVCLLISIVVTAITFGVAFYGAGAAMPADVPLKKHRFTRQQRVQDQRDQDMELARGLEAKVNAHRAGGPAPEGEGRKAPVMLKKVLFFSQENAGEADAEGIPNEWLEKAFQEIDEDGSGAIELSELIECLKLCGLNASSDATENIMKEIDKNMSGDIDIHEFVEFFRSIEELDRFQAKTEQRAHFTQLLCNCCFISHIIIVSILLMNFINMDEDEDPDNYLIFKNMLIAFSTVLAFLLLNVICLPAIRLTLGANMAAWERQWKLEVARRQRAKMKEVEDTPGPRQAAWSTGDPKADGLTELTVNAAVFGTSYRVSKQTLPVPSMAGERTQGFGNTLNDTMRSNARQQESYRTEQSRGGGVFTGQDGTFERYRPEAYMEAAMRAKEAQVPASFSPMQIRDMEMPAQQPEMPGALALQDNPRYPGGLTGTGFYRREL
mmetsp:Transcript_63040/g.133056  ORF Transcript_63040/g.133056 Transcript_63040/m.133056 type:complete len:616 (-) Transcript_63040:43-1890(-)